MASIFMGEPNNVKRVYSQEVINALVNEANLIPDKVVTKDEILSGNYKDTEYIFSTWGMSHFEKDEIKENLPKLKAVFYSAGSVQGFAKEFLEVGIEVHSAWAANAVPVAEYTVAQIILANKGFFQSSVMFKKGNSHYKEAHKQFSLYGGNFNTNVGIIGAGMIGRMVIERLKDYKVTVYVCDPFLSEEKAAEMGAVKCELSEMFEKCDVISNHVANNPQTVGMINAKHFALMKPYSTFINTGRGAQIVEPDMIAFLKERTDVTAVLDVTHPEPPLEGSEMYDLDNVILTPHIAGSSGKEVVRMAEYMLEEYRLYAKNEPTKYSVSLKMLETMA